MIFPTFRSPLMAAVGGAPLLSTGLVAARQAAIALASVTVGTDPEHRITPAASPLPENNIAMNCHPR
jgi:hypothetical protein